MGFWFFVLAAICGARATALGFQARRNHVLDAAGRKQFTEAGARLQRRSTRWLFASIACIAIALYLGL